MRISDTTVGWVTGGVAELLGAGHISYALQSHRWLPESDDSLCDQSSGPIHPTDGRPFPDFGRGLPSLLNVARQRPNCQARIAKTSLWTPVLGCKRWREAFTNPRFTLRDFSINVLLNRADFSTRSIVSSNGACQVLTVLSLLLAFTLSFRH